MFGYKGKKLKINTYRYVSPEIKSCLSCNIICRICLSRQCLCIYKDQKVGERFSLAIQGVVSLCVRVLKNIRTCLKSSSDATSNSDDENDRKDLWTTEELERLLQFVAKVFMLQFPLYAGPKSAGLRNEEVSAAEATQMAVYCDVHDSTGEN